MPTPASSASRCHASCAGIRCRSRARLPGMQPEAWADTREDAADETGLPPGTFPEACPWTREQALNRAFLPDRDHRAGRSWTSGGIHAKSTLFVAFRLGGPCLPGQPAWAAQAVGSAQVWAERTRRSIVNRDRRVSRPSGSQERARGHR
ncbi:DUF29 family protein [Benzoatithermus flavus]|uniref:DUF29 family protein n=1 Tax=Benzoatithermus flavus TaxID=3108223 RepID=UPI003AADE02F